MQDVFIHGSGIVAHTMALAMAQLRLRVAISEPRIIRASDSRAFAITASSRDLLTRLGAWPLTGISPVARMKIYSVTGASLEPVTDVTLATPVHDQPVAWMADATALESALLSALHAQPCVTFDSQACDMSNATLEIICEGKDASHAVLCGAQIQSLPYPQSAVAARIQATAPHEHAACQWFQNGEVLAFLPLGSSEPGNFMAMVWSVSHERAAQLQSLAPNELAAQAMAASCGQLGEISLHSPTQSWPLSMSRPKSFFGPCKVANGSPSRSWILAGDAAHTVHPLAGLGLNLGLSDVAALAQILAKRQRAEHWRPLNDPRLLRQYERDRQAALAKLAAATDGVFQLFRTDHAPLPSLRRWGLKVFDASLPLKHWLGSQVRML